MNNLTTRKIVLGLLMTCVLAFGVQGVVEAVTTTLGSESTSTVDPTARQVESDVSLTISGISAETVTTGEDDPTQTIRISTSNIQLTSPVFATSVTLSNNPTASQRAYTDNAITGFFRSVGTASITVTYTDLATDAEKEADPPTQTSNRTITHKYTYYVVRADADIPETTTFSLAGASRGYQTGLNGRTDFSIYSNSSGNYPVTYSVAGGSATLYFNDDPYMTSDPGITTTISSSSRRKVWLDMNGAPTFGPGATSIVTVNIGETSGTPRSSFNVVYIIGSPKLGIGLTADTDAEPDTVVNAEPLRNRYRITNGTAGMGAGTITATVHDGTATVDTAGVISGGTIAGALVKFELRHKGSTAGYLTRSVGTRVDANNNTRPASVRLEQDSIAQTLYVRTGTGGTAAVTYAFGTLRNQEITVSSVGLSKMVTAEIGAGQTDERISVKTNRRQSGDPKKYDLVAEVEDGDGEPIPDKTVTFSTVRGTLTPVSTVPTGVTNTAEVVRVETNDFGEAHVVYDIGSHTGRQEILASFLDGTDRESVTFVIGGSGQSSQSGQSGTQQQRLDISVFGEDGDTSRAVIVNALNSAGQAVSISIPITLSGTALVTSQTVNTGAVTTITPPTDPETYTLIATDPAGNYASDTETITVGEPAGEGTLNVTTVGVPVNNQQTIEVTVEDADGDAPTGEVVVTLTGPGISRTVETLNGTGRAIITLPDTGTTYTLRLSADGYATREVTLSVSGVVQDDTETQTRDTTPGGEASSIRIASDPFPSGPANRRLAQPLRVQVLDANNRGVANVRVTFEVVSGQGRLSQRGNGRAIRAQTDSSGNASANYTPLADGTSRVRATAAGVTQTVTFTITAGAAAPSPDDTTPSETGVTPSREINPVVQVNASQRPPMLWVDGGKIYALVGASVQEFASGVEGAMNIAVGGGKVYWTEKTGESAGTINSANLNGSNVQELTSILAVPMGIAVDATNSKLYWTNSRGRIQTANLDGSDITTVLPNLPGPMDIAVARGNVYWTQYDATTGAGNVGIVNPNTAQKVARYTSTGSDAPGSLTISGGKVYWTEMTGTSSGTINSANLNGTNAMELASILAVPSGISVDGSRSQLYWTNSRGRIQRANLDGSKIQNVVSGLGSPGDMVSSNSIAAPVATPPTTTTTTTTASNKYDVNGDGSVDNMDAGLVADALGTTNAKYDVNGDGSVNFLDLLLVFDNRDDGAAAAPTIVGMQMTAAQVDILQEQIDLLIATGDRSPAAMRTLIYLQQLIATARPEKTQLLANYPNPFNPETWIPYELATDTTVKITIYNTQGVVIRTLELGHQAAGYYTGRDRAAYWDGRNALGEQVASGIYFYQFETDDMSSMRKMVILK